MEQLKDRAYFSKILKQAFYRAKNTPWKSLLTPKIPNNTDRIIIPLSYNGTYTVVRHIIEIH